MRTAECIAKLYHEQGHIGPERIRTRLREKFWVIGEAELSKRVYNNCEECTILRQNHKFKIEGNDPIAEQKELKIMQNIGMDHTSAIMNDNNKNRYILLFICLSTKKIKLELVNSLGKEATELALVRLEAQYGPIENIRSDNYKTFSSLSKNHPNWKFTAPYSPHQGGLWERSIQSVKRVLLPYVINAYSDPVWSTLLAVVESAVNTKPLTRLINDPDQRVVTPEKISQVYNLAEERWDMRRKWKKKWKKIAKQWHVLMLDEILRERRLETSGISPKVGMRVLVRDDGKRALWKKAEITHLIKDHDGKVKSVEIKERKKQKPFRRHLKDLVPLL